MGRVESRNKIGLAEELQFQDKVIACKVCGQTFIFTSGEQLFYSDRNLAEPKRCPGCRAKHRQGEYTNG